MHKLCGIPTNSRTARSGQTVRALSAVFCLVETNVFFSPGPNWPINGEIDIIEGVGDYTNNQATIHTNPGCTLSTSNSNSLLISGSVVGGTDCAALTTGNQGCGIRSNSNKSYGAAFNNNGGGTYASAFDLIIPAMNYVRRMYCSAVGFLWNFCLFFPEWIRTSRPGGRCAEPRYMGVSAGKVASQWMRSIRILQGSFGNI